MARTLLGVVDDDDGHLVAALKVAQEPEEWCDLTAGILIATVESDEGVEDEELRPQRGDGIGESDDVVLEIEPQARRRDDLDVEPFELESVRSGDSLEPLADNVKSVLGGIQEHPSGVRYHEAPQARSAGGDSDGEVEGEEGLARLGFTADQANGLFAPQ
jgi:hypothetical protein